MNRCGIDIVEISRIAQMRNKEDFFRRIFSEKEQLLAASRTRSDEFAAGRWAVKEAVAKALGCGFGKWCSPDEIEVLPDEFDAPQLFLHGRAAERAGALGIISWCISISHEKNYAAAMAVAEIRASDSKGEEKL